jgi:hypothetical protein
MNGSLNMVMSRIIDSKARTAALDLLDRAASARQDLERIRSQETIAFACGIQAITDPLDVMAHRLGSLEEQRDARAKADEAAEARSIQQMLDSLPSPDDPNATAIYPPRPNPVEPHPEQPVGREQPKPTFVPAPQHTHLMPNG